MLNRLLIKQRVTRIWDMVVPDHNREQHDHHHHHHNHNHNHRPTGEESERRARRATARLIKNLEGHLVSILYYPHPFSNGGLVVVFRDHEKSVVDLIIEAFKCVQPDFSLHCLRRAELFELSLPSFTWLHVLNRRTHLAHCLKYRGLVLHGEDVRAEIPSPPEPRLLLSLHLEASAHFMRNHAILGTLMRGSYVDLLKRIDWQFKCLMSTALLLHDEWDMQAEDIPARFESAFQDKQLEECWREFRALLKSADVMNEQDSRRAAYEAVWLFESFLRRLRSYAQ